MAMFNNQSFRLLSQGLDAVWYKQKVINQNISNSDTPGYKTKNVDFKAVLKEQCKYPQYHKYDRQPELKVEVRESTEEGTNQQLDGNNVNVQEEMMKLADAQYQYETLANQMTNEFTMLRTAISK